MSEYYDRFGSKDRYEEALKYAEAKVTVEASEAKLRKEKGIGIRYLNNLAATFLMLFIALAVSRLLMEFNWLFYPLLFILAGIFTKLEKDFFS